MFHASWSPGHNSTDYSRYLSIPPGSQELYKVTTYQSAYEPYVIMSKRVPWYVMMLRTAPLIMLNTLGVTRDLSATVGTRRPVSSKFT